MRCPLVGCGTEGPNAIANAIGYAQFFSRSQHAVIRVYDEAGNVIETQEHAGGGGCASSAFSNYQGRTPEET